MQINKKMFSIYLKKGRENIGLTQMEAADRIGVSITTIQNWENGFITPSTTYFEKIIETYNLLEESFYEKYKQAIFSKKVLEENKESKKDLPFNPNLFMLTNWVGKDVEDALINLKLTAEETELLGLELIYSKVSQAKIDGIIEEQVPDIPGMQAARMPWNFSGTITENKMNIPESFITKLGGSFKFLALQKSLLEKLINNDLKEMLSDYLINNPSNTFEIGDLSPKEFWELTKHIGTVYHNIKFERVSLHTILEELVRLLKAIECHSGKLLIFEDDVCVEYKNVEEADHPFGRLYFFRNDDCYVVRERKKYNEMTFEDYKIINGWPLKIFMYFFTFNTVKDEEDLEIYDKFVETYKDTLVPIPERPKAKERIYLEWTQKGKDFLKWYRENIET